MSDKVLIGQRPIGRGSPPLIVAEMSGNHNRSLSRALQIVEAAAAAGAHALKIQTYTADTMTLDISGGAFSIDDDRSLWDGRTLYSLYAEACTPWEWHGPIFTRCRELGLIPFSTPFDVSAIQFLESLEVPAYKIASFENVDLPLIRAAAATGKPLLISTGMATVAEIDEAVQTARGAGCRSLVLLKCTSAYPAGPEMANLRTIPHMRELFDVEVGLSDHTMGFGVAVAAVAFGATLIEKHFTLSRADGGVDAAFSMEPAELKLLASETVRAAQAIGTVSYGVGPGEAGSLRFRRSLYVVRDLNPGDELTPESMRALRPGDGLSPKYYDVLLGKRVTCAVKKGTPVDWRLVG